MRKSTKVQMFIHHHYDNIKLVLQFVIIFLVIGTILNIKAVSDRLSNEGTESRTAVLERIDRETQEQTRQIQQQTDKLNQQFQALCFIIVQIAGPEALTQIDPPLEEQCRDLTAELRQDAADNAAGLQSSNAPVPQSPRLDPVDQRTPQQVQPEPPRQNEQGNTSPPPPASNNQSWLFNVLDGLLIP